MSNKYLDDAIEQTFPRQRLDDGYVSGTGPVVRSDDPELLNRGQTPQQASKFIDVDSTQVNGRLGAVVNVRGQGLVKIPLPTKAQTQGYVNASNYYRDNPQELHNDLNRKYEQARQIGEYIYQNMDMLDKAALWTAPAPLVGDIAGLINDLRYYITDPDSRTVTNGLLTTLGMAPFIPAMGTLKKTFDSAADVSRNIPDFDVSPNIIVEAPKEILRETRRAGTTGQYWGAPRGVTSPQKLGSLRHSLRGSLERGAPGRWWYDRSSAMSDQLVGSRPAYKDLYTGSIAATSRGASVPSNRAFGVKGYNQMITGSDIDTGRFPQSTGELLDKVRSGKDAKFGPKTGPFYEAVNVGTAGTDVGRPTNDIWMARAFNYTDADGNIWEGGLGEAQHRFMDAEINDLVNWANDNKVAGYDDWTPERVQASIWVDTKARTEGIEINDAAQDFADGFEGLTARINVESEPARGLDHLSGTQNNPDLAEALQAGQREVLTNQQGQDAISLYAGGLTMPTETGYGYYKGNSAPTDVVNTLGGFQTGGNTIDPASQSLVEGIAATHGLLRGQESVGYNYIRPAKNVVDRNAAVLTLGRSPTQDEMLKIGGAMDAAFDGAIIPTNTGTGINALVVDDMSGWAKSRGIDPKDSKAVAQGWQRELAKITKAELGVKPEWGTNSGDLVGSWDSFKPSEYMKVYDSLDPMVTKNLDLAAQRYAPLLDEIDVALVDEFPNIGKRSEILKTTRRALAEGGFSRVRELVSQGILPAIVLGVGVKAVLPSLQSLESADTGGSI